MFRVLMVFWIFLLSVGGSAKNADTVTPPAPSLTISFERQNIRQKDCANVELLIVNDSEYELTKTSLTVAGPSFVTWYTNPCEKDSNESGAIFGSSKVPSLELDTIPARSTVRRRLHLHTAPTIEVGEYNSLFMVEYHWKMNGVLASSFVSTEKPIKVSFLGNESVAGIPLALAGFIVPGLIFWWIIKLFGASWSIEALSDQMIYSILVSIGLVFVGTWLGFSDISTGISMERLLRLAIAGLVVGVGVGGVDLLIRKVRARQAATLEAARLERQIRPEESEASLLGKLLELPAEAQLSRPLIRLKKGNQEYVGALGARTAFAEPGSTEREMIYSLVGSFSINLNTTDETIKERVKQLRDAGQMRALVTLAEEKHLLGSIEEVQRVNANGEFEPSGDTFMQWKEGEVASVATNQESWDQPALEVK